MPYINFKPSSYFNAIAYSGNGGNGTTTTQAITGAGFQPDWVWLKQRTGTQNHQICDVIRGANNILLSNGSNSEGADTQIINSFDSDGFTAGYQDQANDTGHTYISWLWRAANSQGSANTTGSINTTYTSANTTSGFSIIKYSGNGSAGATIGHGLGVAPKCVIIKRMDTTSNWIFGTHATGFNKFLYLNGTDTETTNSGAFNNTAPSSTVITLGSWNDVNNSSGTYICYAFAEKKGFSRFGLYEGNGSTSGTFVYTGFKPKFVMLKGKGNSSNWGMHDGGRDIDNPVQKGLLANTNAAEDTHDFMDFLSNGFRLRSSSSNRNASGQGYVYMAFAEEPFVASNEDPATAR